MTAFSYGENGEKIIHSVYSKRGCMFITDIFPHDKDTTGKLIINKTGVNLEHKYKVQSKSRLVLKIFAELMLLIITDVAEGHLFKFPGKTEANICLRPMSDFRTKIVRQIGLFTDIDIVKSGFKIPRFTFDFGPKYLRKNRELYVPKRFEDRAFRNAENGMLNYTSIRKQK